MSKQLEEAVSIISELLEVIKVSNAPITQSLESRSKIFIKCPSGKCGINRSRPNNRFPKSEALKIINPKVKHPWKLGKSEE